MTWAEAANNAAESLCVLGAVLILFSPIILPFVPFIIAAIRGDKD